MGIRVFVSFQCADCSKHGGRQTPIFAHLFVNSTFVVLSWYFYCAMICLLSNSNLIHAAIEFATENNQNAGLFFLCADYFHVDWQCLKWLFYPMVHRVSTECGKMNVFVYVWIFVRVFWLARENSQTTTDLRQWKLELTPYCRHSFIPDFFLSIEWNFSRFFPLDTTVVTIILKIHSHV